MSDKMADTEMKKDQTESQTKEPKKTKEGERHWQRVKEHC